MGSSMMELIILEHRLHICTFGKVHIPELTHTLIDLALLQHTKCRFFVFTETCDDYSVVVDTEGYKLLAKNEHVKAEADIWVPISVSAGAYSSSSAVNMNKIAKTLIIPLADNDISVFGLSTYQTDYILAKERDIRKIVRTFSSDFDVLLEVNGEQVLQEPTYGSSSSLSGLGDTVRPIVHHFRSPKNRIHIASIDPDSLHSIGIGLIENMFYSSRYEEPEEGYERFFSFAVVDRDVSVVLDEKSLSKFPSKTLFVNDECWRMIKIGNSPQGLGFDECGIAAQMSDPIADANITEYYISTFYNDHMLVPENSLKNVLKLLESRQVKYKKGKKRR